MCGGRGGAARGGGQRKMEVLEELNKLFIATITLKIFIDYVFCFSIYFCCLLVTMFTDSSLCVLSVHV